DTGDDSHLFAGLGNLTFDSRGYAWITNNTNQGTPFSGQFMVVLKPNGRPSDGTNGTPVSPLTGGGLLGGGYGVSIDPQGSVWVSNFGWGPPNCTYCFPTPDGNGSVSEFSASGTPISGPNGYQGGPVRVQGLAADAQGNIWIASYGTRQRLRFSARRSESLRISSTVFWKPAVRYRTRGRRNGVGH